MPMDLDKLNFSKKPEEVKVLKTKSHPFRKNHIYIGKIKPNRMIRDRCAYEITYLDEKLILDGFYITTYTKDDQITSINLFGEHPNCDLNTNIYCWPKMQKGLPLNQETLHMILTNLKTYYLDDAYFMPEGASALYKKLDSISIRLNKGDN